MQGTKILSNLLQDESDKQVKFIIPKYQRAYVWGKIQIEQLINDIDENERGHFIGTVILCQNKTKDNNKIIENEIIDGQQRITTLSLLMSCLYEKLSIIWNEIDPKDFDKRDFESLFKKKLNAEGSLEKVLLLENNDKPRLELSILNNDNDKYKYNLYKKQVLKEICTYSNFGNTSFAHSIKYIENTIEALLFSENSIIEKFNKLIMFIDKVLHVEVAPIITEEYSKAYKLFECLNNRGMALSAIQLLKNIAFERYTSKYGNEKIDDIDKIWQENILNNLIDANIQTRFLRQYYNAFRYNERIKQNAITKATTSNITKIYEFLIKNDLDFLLNEFKEKSLIYSELIDDNKMQSEIKNDLIRLKRVNFVPAYTFLLYLFAKEPDNIELKKQTINFLVAYGFRRNLTDYPRTRNLDKMFIDLIDECESNGLNYAVIENFLTQNVYFSPFEKIIETLSGNIYEDNYDLTRFILCEIQNKLQPNTKENQRNLWEKDDNNKYIYEIEHILPQKLEDLSKNGWAKMIANGDNNLANEIRYKYTHKIGNLTLSAYNQKLGTLSFDKKRDRVNNENQYIGYKNGLKINEDLENEIVWNKEKILNRSLKLIKIVLDLFKIKYDEIPEDKVLYDLIKSQAGGSPDHG